VKIYWLSIDQKRWFFYSDDSEESHVDDEGGKSESPAAGRFRGWVHNRFLKFKSAWQHAEHGALHWMRQVWDWLHTLTRPDEPMLARLRPARRIEIHHPSARGEDEVRAAWRDYLNRQWWRHLLWLSVNAVIAPVSALLAILPGPNLIGYWFLYRAVHHSLVIWGIGRVLRNKVPTELHASAELDSPIDQDENGAARHAALNGASARLGDHVAWWKRPSRWMFLGRGRVSVATSLSEAGQPEHRPETRVNG
jgi:hypothetical protein